MSVATSWSDTFIGRTVSNAWGNGTSGQAWGHVKGTDTLAVSSGEGTITSASSAAENVMLYGSDVVADAQVVARVKLGVLTFGDYMGLLLRNDAAGLNGYQARNAPNNATGIQIIKQVAGANTTLGTFTIPFSYGNGSIVWFRFLAKGTTLSIKCWQDGTPEPAAYTGSVVDSTYTSGQYGVLAAAAPGSVMQADHFSGNILQPLQTHMGNHRAFARVQ